MMNPKMKSWARQAEAEEVVGNSLGVGCEISRVSLSVSYHPSNILPSHTKKELNNRPFFDLKGVLALRLGEKEPTEN